MSATVDYYFNYRYLVRFFLVHKVDIFSSSFELPFLGQMTALFSVIDLSDTDDPRTFNYYYLFRFFLGTKGFITNVKTKFLLGRTFYSFNIVSFFSKRFLFFPLHFLVNDVIASSNKNTYGYYRDGLCFTMSFFDTNVFLEKKNNLGLFTLKNPLVVKFFFSSRSFEFYGLLLNSLKII